MKRSLFLGSAISAKIFTKCNKIDRFACGDRIRCYFVCPKPLISSGVLSGRKIK